MGPPGGGQLGQGPPAVDDEFEALGPAEEEAPYLDEEEPYADEPASGTESAREPPEARAAPMVSRATPPIAARNGFTGIMQAASSPPGR